MPEFLPAAHYHFLTPCYDFFVRLFFARTFKKIAKIIDPKPGQKILDLGCGPGNLLIELKKSQPTAELTGLDIDPDILRIAQCKVGDTVRLIEASALHIPLQEQFDVVVSTLMIHHLEQDDKLTMLREAHRLLKPGGSMYLFDFAPPRTGGSRLLARIFRHLEPIDDAILGKYPVLMKTAGFKEVKEIFQTRLFGLLKGIK